MKNKTNKQNEIVTTTPNYTFNPNLAVLGKTIRAQKSELSVEVQQDKKGYYFVVNGINQPERYLFASVSAWGQHLVQGADKLFCYVSFKKEKDSIVSTSSGKYSFATEISEGSSVVCNLDENQYRIRNLDGVLSEESYNFAGDSKCGVRRVKLAEDKGFTRYMFADGSLSEPYAMAQDFVDNHGLFKRSQGAGFQYVNIFKEESQQFDSAEQFKNGFGTVKIAGETMYVDILDNISNQKTEEGHAIYEYLNGRKTLQEVKDEFVLNGTIKSALLLFKYIEKVNEFEARVSSGEIITKDEYAQLVEQMKEFRAAVDQKEIDANQAIADRTAEQERRRLVNKMLNNSIADGLGLNLTEKEKATIELPDQKPELPVENTTAEYEQNAEHEQITDNQQTDADQNSESTQNQEQPTETVSDNDSNPKFTITITTKDSLFTKLKRLLFKNKKEEESGKIVLERPDKTIINIYKNANAVDDSEKVVTDEELENCISNLPDEQQADVRNSVHEFLKQRKENLNKKGNNEQTK